nr:PREDICTED: dickkopf-related protein 3 isoform X1 [Anolis carolinensis]|eukprot:XP_016850189.1 PREDICTED: dickkopf-related protein 3 isoform X1 [Anolis carolinensis]
MCAYQSRVKWSIFQYVVGGEHVFGQHLLMTTCSHEKKCPEGFFCDYHFGLCFNLRDEGDFCRQDAHCAEGLICMFGKCQERVPEGQEGARCHHDKDCAPEHCCARHHGEMVCRKRLLLDQGCYVPEGGVAFSMNQVCPCLEGLVCKRTPLKREVPFEYQTYKNEWRCQQK